MAENKTEKLYLIFIDPRFSRMAKRELLNAFPDCKIEPYTINNNNLFNVVFFKFETKDTTEDVLSKIKMAASSFVDFVVPVDIILDMKGPIDYLKVEDALSKVIDSQNYQSFKIEVKKIGPIADKNAKSIEVKLGRDLEKQGYVANLKAPSVMIYAILLNASVMIGHIDTRAQSNYILDSFRQANREQANQVNRSEFKIKEAIAFFEIDLNKCRMALDIGAAPGGWTHYLSQCGIKVIAVDKALLDYKRISEGKRVLVLADETEVANVKKIVRNENLDENVSVEIINKQNAKLDDFDVVHIKSNIKQNSATELIKGFGKFDLLVIDTNTPPLESAEIANSLVGLLSSDASLIMTIKLTTRNFTRHISNVEAELSKNYKELKLKKLLHNRQELTVYGVLDKSNL